jgi:hypothetical protein
MKFVINKRTNQVVMRSTGTISVDEKLFEILEYDPTEEEMVMIQENAIMVKKNGKLEFTDSPRKTAKVKKKDIQDLKVKLENGTITKKERDDLIINLIQG